MADVISTAVNEATGAVFSVWFLIGAALVFLMQCGFAMVETGFTRAKNAGNIIMKNLMDFCIGTVVFLLIGYTLMMSEDYVFGLIGIPNLDLFTNFANFDWSNFVFNLVFAATASTIVSGAMAERTKFSSYCVYCIFITAIIYPIEAGWVWNPEGWLVKLGFVDFAGSCAIHFVGGIAAFVGAATIGPRIGKYTKDGKAKAIPGHSLTLGALGVFLLWFGWYGFNGAAAGSTDELAQIFITTTISPAVATCVTMCFTWIKNGKPDVSMSLNASLAGLVGVTAGCNDVDALGAAIIGIVSGFLVVIAVEVIDIKIKVDDPVGAVAVHCVNGAWGTLAVGLFATGRGAAEAGLFYGGGFKQLGIQFIGFASIAAWTIVTTVILFQIIKHTMGIRASKEEEMRGLDITEHGLISSYADFMPNVPSILDGYTSTEDKKDGKVPVSEAVPIQLVPGKEKIASDVKLTKVDIILKQSKFEELKTALTDIGITGMTVTQVLGCGTQKGRTQYYRGVEVEINLLPKVQVEIVVCKIPAETVINTALKVLYTGNIGDGKIFVYDVEDVVKVRTGERGMAALQDSE